MVYPLLVLAFMAGAAPASQPAVEKQVADILSKMTLEEKIDLCHGATAFETKAMPRVGIPEWRLFDGPHGVRFGTSTAFPTGVSMAATWNTSLIHELGVALGKESKAQGKHVLLGPAVNIVRTPLGGRSFEYMSEDPFLAKQIAVEWIKGIQSQKVAACVKHYAANSQEQERTSIDAQVDERTLREIYLPAFEGAAKEGHAWSAMSAYNKVNGFYCTENEHLQNEILKKDWGWDGTVMSDWGATHSTVGAALHGLDLEMPGSGPQDYFGDPLMKAVKDGQVPVSVIDDKVRRNLRAMVRSGAFEPRPLTPVPHEQSEAVARKVAEQAIVLLKNVGGALPLKASKLTTVAVIGPNATAKHCGAGGSSAVNARHEITPLDGLKAALGPNVVVKYVQGCSFGEQVGTAVPSACLRPGADSSANGLKGEYYGNATFSGEPTTVRTDANVAFNWANNGAIEGLPKEQFSVRWSGVLVPKVSGAYRVGTRSDDGSRLYIDGKLVVDNWGAHAAETKLANVELQGGRSYDVKIEYYQGTGDASCELVWVEPNTTEDADIAEAVDLAKGCDAVVLCVGTTHQWDTEGGDKPSLALMGKQAKLIERVAAANPKTVVVLINGSAVEVDPWRADVPAIVEAWYPGMEGGHAIADVLLGKVNPSGKLPVTFPKTLDDSPAHANGNYPGHRGVLRYDEGVLVGYRWFDTKQIEPAYPFGYGLSYTKFGYSDLKVRTKGRTATVTFKVKNLGKVAGAEVAQVYVRDAHAPVLRPEKELKGFVKLDLNPGESKTATVKLDARAFAYWGTSAKNWVVAPGSFGILVGGSSRDIQLRAKATIR